VQRGHAAPDGLPSAPTGCGSPVAISVETGLGNGWGRPARPLRRVFFQSLRAIFRGSIPVASHQRNSLPERWSSRWWVRQSGTVNSSLTLRPSARTPGH
jgi:hypothetical protein